MKISFFSTLAPSGVGLRPESSKVEGNSVVSKELEAADEIHSGLKKMEKLAGAAYNNCYSQLKDKLDQLSGKEAEMFINYSAEKIARGDLRFTLLIGIFGKHPLLVDSINKYKLMQASLTIRKIVLQNPALAQKIVGNTDVWTPAKQNMLAATNKILEKILTSATQWGDEQQAEYERGFRAAKLAAETPEPVTVAPTATM